MTLTTFPIIPSSRHTFIHLNCLWSKRQTPRNPRAHRSLCVVIIRGWLTAGPQHRLFRIFHCGFLLLWGMQREPKQKTKWWNKTFMDSCLNSYCPWVFKHLEMLQKLCNKCLLPCSARLKTWPMSGLKTNCSFDSSIVFEVALPMAHNAESNGNLGWQHVHEMTLKQDMSADLVYVCLDGYISTNFDQLCKAS